MTIKDRLIEPIKPSNPSEYGVITQMPCSEQSVSMLIPELHCKFPVKLPVGLARDHANIFPAEMPSFQ